jgi:hypothetical protein
LAVVVAALVITHFQLLVVLVVELVVLVLLHPEVLEPQVKVMLAVLDHQVKKRRAVAVVLERLGQTPVEQLLELAVSDWFLQ